MGSHPTCIVPLAEAARAGDGLVGGKAARLGSLIQAGFRVPRGFCITTTAYEQFVAEAGLSSHVAMELGRRPLDAMRWEELWDAALRIRSAFLRADVPAGVAAHIRRALTDHMGDSAVAVRSSAPGEDSQQLSFAGLHESVVGVYGERAVLDAVRTVWASLWSDAALLYRRELALDPKRSRMAVLVQAVELADRSGVAFGRDPRSPDADCAVIEAVPGPCALLVDGSVDPDRWILTRTSGALVEWRPGRRGPDDGTPLLDERDLDHLRGVLSRIETLFGWPPDVEWTGRAPDTVVLQARPITSTRPDGKDQRGWYLTLRPNLRRLSALAARVSGELIPALESEGARFAADDLAVRTDVDLAAALLERSESLSRMFEFTFKMFSQGSATLPSRGMGEIPRQLASRLPPGTIRLGARVTAIRPGSIALDSGEQFPGDAVVVATDGSPAAGWVAAPASAAPAWRSVTCLYFAAARSPLGESIIALNGTGSGLVNNVCVPSDLAPDYAPPGRALVSVSVVGTVAPDDLESRVLAEMEAWFGSTVREWRHLRTYRIERALPGQPPGTGLAGPGFRKEAGVYLCGDHLWSASIEGAIISGLRTADGILRRP